MVCFDKPHLVLIICFVFKFRLFQVEYAIEAVKLGSTVVGIQTKQGSILAIEKRLTSTLLEPSSVEKVMEVDSHIGAAVSGLIGGEIVVFSVLIANLHIFDCFICRCAHVG